MRKTKSEERSQYAEMLDEATNANAFGPRVTLLQLFPLLRVYAESPVRGQLNVFLWGDPGIGKTSLTRQVASSLGLQYLAYDLPQMDYTQITGVPRWKEDEGRMVRYPLLQVPSVGDGLYVLDNVPHAPHLVQNVVLALAGEERKLNDATLGPGWMLVLCGNKPGAGGAFGLQPPAANRFAHFDVQADYPAWRIWASANDVREEIISFLDAFPELLCSAPAAGTVAFPTPRSWAKASLALDVRYSLSGSGGRVRTELDVEGEWTYHTLGAHVGMAAAAHFVSYVRARRHVELERVLSGEFGTWSPSLSAPDRQALEYALMCEARRWWLSLPARGKGAKYARGFGFVLRLLSPPMRTRLLSDLATLDRRGLSAFYARVNEANDLGWVLDILRELGELQLGGDAR